MDAPKKLIVGYDLCEDYTQISCYSYKLHKPVTIGTAEGMDDCPIPTVLCVKYDTKQWLFGEDAVACAAEGGGIRIDHLLSKLKTGEETEILDQKFSAISLLEKFLRKSLMLVKNYFPTQLITKLVVTVKDAHPVIVDGIYEALYQLGIERDRGVVMSHVGAYLYYALSQDKALWMNDVGLFDFDEQGLSYYQISLNRRTNPIVAGVKKQDLSDSLNYSMIDQRDLDLNYIFKNIADTVLYKQIITTLYFTGNGFEGEWAESAIKSLCTGRRAFLGQNLYTKGACYAAKELSGDRKLENYILLNEEMITSSVWIKVYSDARVMEVPLTQAAVPWYEVNETIEVIPEDEAEIEIILRNIMTRDIIRERLVPNHTPDRPKRMTRLGINLTCTSSTNAKITVTDLGFGDFYPETGRMWEFFIEI
ncbi:MAG: hypothetical protein GX306_06055 [Clostridiales bacterium]|nr:hypothetical protein [Clostridiales bacterium]